MSEVLGKDIPIEQQFMTDFWKFRKKYYIPENSDSYWVNLCMDADKICEKYNRNKYFESLVLACVKDFEERYKEVKRHEQNERI